ncbi:MAG TPA: hypothetical protein VHR86_01150, partial [Armatimonadota bacterium]|nr:hypothetical protein [Armatimonadota bacterium]
MTDRLAISFWIWGLYNTTPNGFFDNFEGRMVELKERGFNCIRFDAGTGLCHDAQGRPRGELSFQESLPGYARFTRQMERFLAGRCDPLKRLIEVCTLAKRYQVKVILSSWYYLHTFWFTDEAINKELMGLPPEKRFMHFAVALDRILAELEQRDLQDAIAFAEVFNEADGLTFLGGYGEKKQPQAELNMHRQWHEEALEYLKVRHPEVRFALDTYTPFVNPEQIPRNMQVWNFHSYYLWSVYDVFERKVTWGTESDEPLVEEPIRRFLRRDLVPFKVIRASRGDRPLIAEDWYRRVWLYRNLDPAGMPELERMLLENLEQNVATFKKKAEDSIAQAVKVRDQYFPGIPLVLGEGASYCADLRLRWEERSDAYWDVVEHAARTCRKLGLWGTVAR